MLIAQIAFSAALASSQDKPDHSGLPKLKEIMRVMQAGSAGHISGSRFIETEPGAREYEGDIQIYRQGKNLRYSYGGYFGDNFLLVVNSKLLVGFNDAEPSYLDAPKSWAQFMQNQPSESFGSAVVSFLAPEKDINLFIDTTKAITLDSQAAHTEISYIHTDGNKHSVRLLSDRTIEFRTPNPGFGDFRPPSTDVDSVRVRETKGKFPAWYFEIKK